MASRGAECSARRDASEGVRTKRARCGEMRGDTCRSRPRATSQRSPGRLECGCLGRSRWWGDDVPARWRACADAAAASTAQPKRSHHAPRGRIARGRKDAAANSLERIHDTTSLRRSLRDRLAWGGSCRYPWGLRDRAEVPARPVIGAMGETHKATSGGHADRNFVWYGFERRDVAARPQLRPCLDHVAERGGEPDLSRRARPRAAIPVRDCDNAWVRVGL